MIGIRGNGVGGGDFPGSPSSFKDPDKDGLTDHNDTKRYTDVCIETDSSNPDTDGDGWWDGIEDQAEANPMDPTDSNDYLIL